MNAAKTLAGSSLVSFVWIVSLALLSCSDEPGAVAQVHQADQAGETQLAAQIDALAQAAIAKGAFPGVQIAVTRRGETVVSKGYGKADLEGDTDMDAHAVLKVGSITKQFTAAAVLELVDQGLVSLEDPVTKYLPDYPTHGATITLHHLLSHTSGIPDYPTDGALLFGEPGPEAAVDLVKDKPLDFAPGDSWEYSNTNFILLGMIVEKVSKEAYPDYLAKHVFSAAGLTETYYCRNETIIAHRARGYAVDPSAGAFVNAAPIGMSWAFSAGAICSTTSDLLKWQAALASGKVVSAASRAKMITPVFFNDKTPTTYGYALFVTDFGGHPRIGHGGDIPGFSGELALYPADDLAIAVLGNVMTSDVDDLETAIARLVLGVAPPVTRDLPVPADEAAFVAGTYEVVGGRDQHGEKLTVAGSTPASGVTLRVGDASARLAYQGGHAYMVPGNDRQILTFTGTGASAEYLVVSLEGFLYDRCPRVSASAPPGSAPLHPRVLPRLFAPRTGPVTASPGAFPLAP
jgi:CubicO group peptidase (beta-lactamase class C family)